MVAHESKPECWVIMDTWPRVAEWLLTQGWAGILVMGMLAVIWDQRKEISFLRIRNSSLQDARVSDAKAVTREMVETITGTRLSVQTLTELMKDRR